MSASPSASPATWEQSPQNGVWGAEVGPEDDPLFLGAFPPVHGAVSWRWEVSGFYADRNVATVLVHGDQPTEETARAAAEAAGAEILSGSPKVLGA